MINTYGSRSAVGNVMECRYLSVCRFRGRPCPTEIDREIISTVIDLNLSSRRLIVIHVSTCTSIFRHWLCIDVYKIGQEAFIKRVLGNNCLVFSYFSKWEHLSFHFTPSKNIWMPVTLVLQERIPPTNLDRGYLLISTNILKWSPITWKGMMDISF